jgi:hypothetical protein
MHWSHADPALMGLARGSLELGSLSDDRVTRVTARLREVVLIG